MHTLPLLVFADVQYPPLARFDLGPRLVEADVMNVREWMAQHGPALRRRAAIGGDDGFHVQRLRRP